MVIALVAVACSSTRPTAFSHQVSLVEPEQTPGLLWISSNGQGGNSDKAIHDAQRAIFDQLLFRGVAGSSWNTPMVQSEGDPKLEHPDFYKGFLDELGYRSFILSAQHGTYDKKSKVVTTRIHIDTNALRRHLEQQSIIRPFGL